MQFDMHALTADERYKLMSSSITPRPIAWVTSQSAAGKRNAAPFSFFNMMGAEPPIVALGLMRRADGSYKDTAANIIETKEFVINLVREADAELMNFSCIDAPPEFDEIDAGRIPVAVCSTVAAPRIASAPVSMECRLVHHIDVGAATTVVLGEVLVFHIQDRFIDREKLHIDTPAMQLIGRMHGSGWYARTTDLLHLRRPSYADWTRHRLDASCQTALLRMNDV
jgi:flavin reductase (DIM6/NTAB) family NADH-FMN oxidoreductase RutF